MTIHDLIEALRFTAEMTDGDREVLVVHQAAWPLREVIGTLYDPVGEPDEEDLYPPPLYLVLDGHPHEGSPYGPSEAFENL